MSGVVSRTKQRNTAGKGKSVKSKENGENGVNVSDILKNGKPTKSSSGPSKTSFLVRLMFYTILSIFVVVATLISIDYRSGYLKEAYETNIPTEVRYHCQAYI